MNRIGSMYRASPRSYPQVGRYRFYSHCSAVNSFPSTSDCFLTEYLTVVSLFLSEFDGTFSRPTHTVCSISSILAAQLFCNLNLMLLFTICMSPNSSFCFPSEIQEFQWISRNV